MKIRYLCKPQALNIEVKEGGLVRKDGVEFVLKRFMKQNLSLRNIVYGDDVLVSMLPFSDIRAFLMCPSNAEEKVKALVSERGGFVSNKRSTEAVVEFLTEIYPDKWENEHSSIHSIFFDMDGVIWEEERREQYASLFSIIADYIRNCKGPYTNSPPISIATGAYLEAVMGALNYIPLNKKTIPAKFHRNELPLLWPPIVFEEGYLIFDPVNEITYDLTEERYGLVSPVYRKLIPLIMKLGEEINKRVPEINKDLGAKCKIVEKERAGYNLDLPLGMRVRIDDIRKAHTVIYKYARDLLEKQIPPGVEIEFGGLFSQEELERRQGNDSEVAETW